MKWEYVDTYFPDRWARKRDVLGKQSTNPQHWRYRMVYDGRLMVWQQRRGRGYKTQWWFAKCTMIDNKWVPVPGEKQFGPVDTKEKAQVFALMLP